MDVNKLLDELEDLAEHGQGTFFSRIRYFRKAFFLDIDDVLDLTHQIRASLPQQIQRADQITRDKDRILTEAREQADRMVTEAAEQAELTIRQAQEDARVLVSTHEVTRVAQQERQRMLESARQEAEAMRQGALDYTRGMLDRMNKSVETVSVQITQVQQALQKARDEIAK